MSQPSIEELKERIIAVVCYPWHPLHGRQVVIRGRRQDPGCTRVRCQLVGDETWHVIPEWMLDEARCRRMRLCAEPQACWTALLEMRGLLDDIAQLTNCAAHAETQT